MIDFRNYYNQFFLISFTLLNYKAALVCGQAVALSFSTANGISSSASASSSIGLGVPVPNYGFGQQGNNFLQQLNTNFNQFVQSNFPIIPQPFLPPPNIVQNIPCPQNICNGLFYNENSMDLNNNFANINGNNGKNPARRPNQSQHLSNNKQNCLKLNNNNKNNNKCGNNNNNGNINNKNPQKPFMNRPQKPNLTRPNTQANFNSNSNKRPKTTPKPKPSNRPQPSTTTAKPSTQHQQNPNKKTPSTSTSKPVSPTKPQTSFSDNTSIKTNPQSSNPSTIKPSITPSPTWMIQSPNPEFGGIAPGPNQHLNSNNPQYQNWNTQTPPNLNATSSVLGNTSEGNLISSTVENPLFQPVPPLQPSQAVQLPPTTKRPRKLQPGIIINPDSPYFINNESEESSLLFDIKRR